MKPEIIAQRVKEARIGRGLTQGQLAKLLDWQSHTSIVAIEKGEKDLKMWELLTLSEALGVSPESLYSEEPIKSLTSPSILWRKRGNETEAIRQEEQIIFQHCEDYRLLEKLVPSPITISGNLPEISLDLEKVSFEWANRIADDIYRKLNLGDYPAEVLARRLEDDYGVVLLLRLLENGSAACFREGNSVVIVINETESPWRQIFSLAHELFHAITWNDSLIQKIKENESLFKKNEQLADAFAAALLMPQHMIERDFAGRKITHAFVVASARQYGVSAEAMLWRLHHLRFFNFEAVKKTLADPDFQELDKSDKSIHKKAVESSKLTGSRFLRLAYLAYESGKISKSRFANMLGVNLRDLELYLSKYGFDLTNDKEIITGNS